MKNKLFNDEADRLQVQLIVQSVFAGFALSGLLAANRGPSGPEMSVYCDAAWKAGDLMTEEFMRRASTIEHGRTEPAKPSSSASPSSPSAPFSSLDDEVPF